MLGRRSIANAIGSSYYCDCIIKMHLIFFLLLFTPYQKSGFLATVYYNNFYICSQNDLFHCLSAYVMFKLLTHHNAYIRPAETLTIAVVAL